MLKIKQLFAVLIFLLAHNPAWADAEFSDEPVNEIIHPDWFEQSFADFKEDIAEAKRLEKFSAEYADEPDYESWKAKQGRR